METLSLEAAGSDVAILNNEISAYYEQFENQNFTGIETDFNGRTKNQNRNGKRVFR